MEILDVGCGVRPLPKATVCGDLYLRETMHRIKGQITKDAIKGKNLLCFDCYHLPFRDKSFDAVYSRYLLEHLEYPTIALREFKRVSKKKVILRVPDFRGLGMEDRGIEGHYNSWSVNSLRNMLKLVFKNVNVEEVCIPLTWDRRGLMPKIFNHIMKRFLWRFFVFNIPELIGICYIEEGM